MLNNLSLTREWGRVMGSTRPPSVQSHWASWTVCQYNSLLHLSSVSDQIRSTQISQWARAWWGFKKLNQEIRHHQGGWAHYLDHPPCSDKSQNLGFGEINFCNFGGAQKNFFDYKKPYLALETPFLGRVIPLELFGKRSGSRYPDGDKPLGLIF